MAGKRKSRAVDATGRNKYDRHVRLHHWLLESPAWRSLNPCARAALIEFYSLYNGSNNGDIFLSVRHLAERLGINPRTASKALADLTERGFIRVRQKGSFNQKVKSATIWILTEFSYADQLPGKDFMRWQPPVKIQNTVARSASDGCTQYHRGPILTHKKAAIGGTGCIREAH